MKQAVLVLLGAILVCSAASGKESPPPPLPEAARKLSIQAAKAFASGHLPEAASSYEQALRIAPDSPSLLVSLAAVDTRLGKTDESRTLLLRALQLDLNNSQAWLLLGMNALEKKQNEEAFAALTQAVLRDEGNPRAHNYLGMAAGRKGWNDAAEQELRKAVEIDQNYADANFNLAVLYLGRTPPLCELARRHYQRALDLGSPRDPALEKQMAKSVGTGETLIQNLQP